MKPNDMAASKKYFHDHLVLLLLSVNAFLALAGGIFILVRLIGSHGNGFIVQCRDCADPTAINKFTTGNVTDILAFVAFGLIVLAVNTSLSLRVYQIHRQLALTVLGLGVLLLSLNVIIGYELLLLR